jgi:hypothetical protein
MKIAEGPEREYQDWKAKNVDPYGARIFSYGEDWANLMEAHMAEGISLEKCAEQDSRAADTDGITGFMYGASVSILAQSWIHGEQLRRWHNLKTQLGTEGEKANEEGGTLNPTLLNIGSRK